MTTTFEEDLAKVLSVDHALKKRIYDPEKSKQRDHKRRSEGKARFDKENKMIRKLMYRSFRAKNKRFCQEITKTTNEGIEFLIEPLLKKTSGKLI